MLKEILSSENFITEVVNMYSDTIYRVALHITCNREDAYDVCQEVFLRLLNNKEKIKSDEHLKSWLIRTAVNCSKTVVLQAYNRRTVPIDEINENQFAVCQLHNEDTTITKVMKLPEKYRMTIYLYYYQEQSVAEIADILEISQSGVKSRLARGRKLLEKIIREEENYE